MASSVITSAELIAPAKRGRSYGGQSPDAQDSGATVRVWLASVLNARRVLDFGARPAIEEKGPYEFRAYTDFTNATTSETGASFYQRQHMVHRSGDLDEPVTIANPAFRYLEHTIKTKADIVTESFEEGVVPLLFAGEIARLKTLIPALVTRVLLPELVEEVMLDVARTHHAGSAAPVQEQWRHGADGIAPNGTASPRHSLVLPRRRWLGRLDADPGPISRRIAQELWAFSNPWSFLNTARTQPGQPAAWQTYLRSANGDGLSDSSLAAFAAYFVGLDGRYSNISVAQVHAEQLTDWVTGLSTAGSRTGSDAALFQRDVASVLFNHSLLPSPDWDLLPAAQLASNAASGLAFWVRNIRAGGVVRNLNETAGSLLINSCPIGTALTGAGASLADFEDVQDSGELAAPPEMSCFTSREADIVLTEAPLSAVAAAASGIAQASLEGVQDLQSTRFQSKLSVQDMQIAMDLLTSGSSMTGFSIQGSRITSTFMRNSRNLLESPSVASNILGTATSRDSGREGAVYWISQLSLAMQRIERSAPGSPDAEQAKLDVADAADRYQQHLASADVSLINGICSTTYLPPQFRIALPLTCYELLDVVAWAKFVSRHVVWFPQFVQRSPTTGLPDASLIRTGPLVQLTARDALFGYQDYGLHQLAGQSFPGVGPANDPDEGAFAVRALEQLQRLYVASGADDLANLGQVVRLGENQRGATVWGDITPATGAWSLLRVMGLYDRQGQQADLGPPGGSITVWDPKSLRPVRYRFAGTVQTPHLKLWRLRLENSAAWPYFTSDREADAPFCFRSLTRLPGPGGDALSIPLLIGKPNFLDCETSERAYGYSRMSVPTNGTDGSEWLVEPVTGTVISTTIRWATYLRWGPSAWYPFLRPTIGPLVRVERTTAVPDSMQQAIRLDLDAINYQADVAIPVSLNLLAVISLVLSAVFLVVIFYPPKEPVGLAEKQKRRREQLEKARAAKAAKAAAQKKLMRAQMLADAEQRKVRQPGAVVMSSALGRVASSAATGVRGAPSFNAMSSLASAASLGDPKLQAAASRAANARPWQKPPASALQSPLGASGTRHPTDVLSIGSASTSLPAGKGVTGSSKVVDGKSIMGMSLSQAMASSSEEPATAELVQAPDGSTRRKQIKRGSMAMKLSPKRRVRRRKPQQVAPEGADLVVGGTATAVLQAAPGSEDDDGKQAAPMSQHHRDEAFAGVDDAAEPVAACTTTADY
jgi:hypothetical protein